MAELPNYEGVETGTTNYRTTEWLTNATVMAERILKRSLISGSLTIPIQSYNDNTSKIEYVTTTFPFFMENDFNAGTVTNEWKSFLDWDGGFLKNWFNLYNLVSGGAMISLQSEAMSSLNYQGTSFSGFSLPITFIALSRSINPAKIIKTIVGSTLPIKISSKESISSVASAKQIVSTTSNKIQSLIDENVSNEDIKEGANKTVDFLERSINDCGFSAPLRYGLTTQSSDEPLRVLNGTTVSIQIGEYFRADKLVINSANNITFSKEIIAPSRTDSSADYGFPLWGQITLNLQPTSLMHKDKYESYFTTSYKGTFVGNGTTNTETTTSTDTETLAK